MIKVISISAAIFILLYTIVSMGYGRLENWLKTNTPSAVQRAVKTNQLSNPNTSTGSKKIDYKIIVQRNIFSAVLDVKDEKPPVIIDRKPTDPSSLSLSLLGTIAGGQKEARAIIQNTKTKAQDMYQIGDAVENGIIKVIERGKVILQVRGRNEVLLIKKDKNPSVQSTARPSRTRSTQPRVNNTKRVRIQPRRRLPASNANTARPRRP